MKDERAKEMRSGGGKMEGNRIIGYKDGDN
jgi:hypothetical protein